MTAKLITAVAVLLFASTVSAQVFIPRNQREHNYDSGSCVYASCVTQLRQAGAPKLARYIRRNFAGGEYLGDFDRELRRWGVRTRFTSNGNKTTLDFAHTRKLTAVITYHTNHACLFLGWYINPNTNRITHAYVLNPNHPNRIETPTYVTFMNNWRRNDGEAIVIVPRRAK